MRLEVNAAKPKKAEVPMSFHSIDVESVVESNVTIKDKALSIFMKYDYLKRYYEAYPPRPKGFLPFEVDVAGQSEWLQMSGSAKALYIEMAKKMKAEGRSLYNTKTISEDEWLSCGLKW
ncbi:hypothetical protein OROMI_022987 [Orobanche minor]